MAKKTKMNKSTRKKANIVPAIVIVVLSFKVTGSESHYLNECDALSIRLTNNNINEFHSSSGQFELVVVE